MTEGEPPVHELFYPSHLDLAAMTPVRWAWWALWLGPAALLSLMRAVGVVLAGRRGGPGATARMARAAGFRITVRGTVPPPGPGRVVISNHLTYWDPIVLRAGLGLEPTPATLVWYRVNRLNQDLARPVLTVRETGKNLSLLREMKRHLQVGNLLVFPEATVTDGLGVLAFDRSAFSLGAPVCVCALRYRRAVPFFRPTALRERLMLQAWADLLQPWVEAEIQVLGQWEREPGEDAEAFAGRCQRAVAAALGVPATAHTWRDRRALLRDLGREVVHVPQ